ncbi:MAG: TIGR02646 family protein [Magnetococcales bacterium]|nr:TIGR02646 family protein [Magnetococcales bacterium]MBF0156604.1 TIGR02646 family protein [Magnetococcales bacterium]
MKYICKGSPPKQFTDWLATANDAWKPEFDSMYSNIKTPLKQSLMKEQGYICCYCERRLRENDSHVEHFKPQKNFKKYALDYGNMLCSCQLELARGEPRHCGNSKGDWFDEKLLISPLDPNCERKFRYTVDGKILPADNQDAAAMETIKALGLDLEKLNKLRKAAIDEFAEDSWNEIVGTLSSSGMPEYYPFHTAILGYYRDV